MDIKFFQDIPQESLNFIDNLQASDLNFNPTLKDSTNIGKKINMGYMCYVLKIYKMTKIWDSFDKTMQDKWINKLNTYQSTKNPKYKNYFVDPEISKYLNSIFTVFNGKSLIKSSANTFLNKNYESKDNFIFKTLNADNKQTISTFGEIGHTIKTSPLISFNNYKNLNSYLNSYDWSKPWDAGAQFSSLALYNKIFELGLKDELLSFIEKKLDRETGSYFDVKPTSNRQIINGAMKVITGLDWIEKDIHLPKNLIDFCLNNKPEFEGCDLVDYIYVLFRCSSQTDYKKNQVVAIFEELLEDLKILYHQKDKGFSYFVNKSQTHYYGVKISKGSNTPDLHGTILSIWAIVMILETLEKNIHGYKLIKP